MSQFLFRLGRGCARHPFRAVGSWVLVAVTVLVLAGSIGGDYQDDFTVPGVESQHATDVLEERFPTQAGESGRVVFHVDEGRIDDPENQAAVHAAIAELATAADVTGVSDPYDPRGPTVSGDGQTAFAVVQYSEEVLTEDHLDEALEAIEVSREAGVQSELSGEIAAAGKEVEGSEGIGLVVALIVLVIAFGSIVAAGMPIAVALVGILIGLGGVGIMAGFTSVPLTSATLAVMIGLGVGIDYALFVVTRHREELHKGLSVADAAGTAIATAGQAVLFAGMTVVIAIVGLVVSGIPAITTMGYAIALVVIVAMAVAVTLLPALLGWAKHGIDKFAIHRHKTEKPAAETVSGRWAAHVARNPIRYAIGSFAALLAITVPVLSLRIGFADDGNQGETTTERQAYDLLADGFGPGFNGPLLVVVELDAAGDTAAVAAVRDALTADPGVVAVGPPSVNEAGDTVVLTAIPSTSPQDEATEATVDRLRARCSRRPPRTSVPTP